MKLLGVRRDVVRGDEVVVADPSSPPVWARFYEIGTNRPFFCGREGVKKIDLAAFEPEPRNAYEWYRDRGAKVATPYAVWKKVLERKEPPTPDS